MGWLTRGQLLMLLLVTIATEYMSAFGFFRHDDPDILPVSNEEAEEYFATLKGQGAGTGGGGGKKKETLDKKLKPYTQVMEFLQKEPLSLALADYEVDENANGVIKAEAKCKFIANYKNPNGNKDFFFPGARLRNTMIITVDMCTKYNAKPAQGAGASSSGSQAAATSPVEYSVEDAAITIEGNGFFSGHQIKTKVDLSILDVPITMVKPLKSKDFTTTYNIAQKIQGWKTNYFEPMMKYVVQIEKVVEEDLQAGKIKEVTDQLMAQINQFTVQTAFTGTGETLQFRLSYNATDTLKFGENLTISEVALILNIDNSVTAADPQSNQVPKKTKKNQNPSAPSSQPQKHGNPKITGGTLYVQIEGQLIDFILKNFEVSEDINRYVAVDFNSFCLVAVTHQTTYYGDFATDLLNTCLKNSTRNEDTDARKGLFFRKEDRKDPNTELVLSEEGQLNAGFYLSTNLDLQKLHDLCWSYAEEAVKTKENINMLWDTEAKTKNVTVKTAFPVLMVVNKQAIIFELPKKMEGFSDFAKSCVTGMLLGAPNFLTSGHVKISQFQYTRNKKDPSKTVFKIGVTMEDIQPLFGKLRVDKIEVNATLKDTRWSFEGTTEYRIGTSRVHITGSKTYPTPKTNTQPKPPTPPSTTTTPQPDYTINIIYDTFTLSTFFGTGFKIGGVSFFDLIGVRYFELNVNFKGDGSFIITMQGRPLLFGFDKLYMSIQITKMATKKNGQKTAPKNAATVFDGYDIIGGIYFRDISFDELVKRITGEDSHKSIAWLKGLTAVAAFGNVPKAKLINDENDWTLPDEKNETKPDSDSNNSDNPSTEPSSTGDAYRAVVRGGAKKPAAAGKNEKPKAGAGKPTVKMPHTLAFPGLMSAFQNLAIPKNGITFGLGWKVPQKADDCEKNTVCQFLQNNTATRSLEIAIIGSVQLNPLKVKFTAKIDVNIFLINSNKSILAFTGVSLKIEAGAAEPKFRIEAGMTYRYTQKDEEVLDGLETDKRVGNTLTFTGSMEATSTSLRLSFAMEGYIFPHDLFGVGDLRLSMGISFTTGLPVFEFGVGIILGNVDKIKNGGKDIAIGEHTIRMQANFGIDPGNPTKNYIYACVNKLTILEICMAFDIPNCHDGTRLGEKNMVPSILSKSGFPSGLKVSFNAGLEDVELTGLTIPRGFVLVGSMNFLGYEVAADIKLTNEEWKIKVEMSPINWAFGWIQLTRSQDELDKGPKMHAVIGKDFALKLKGYMNALNVIRLLVDIEISDKLIQIHVGTYLLPPILWCEIYLKLQIPDIQQIASLIAGSSSSSGGSLFQLEALASTKEFKVRLKTACIAFVTIAAEVARKVIEFAVKLSEKVGAALTDATIQVEKWENSLLKWKENLNKKKEALEAEEDKNAEPECGKVCVPFFEGKAHCKKFWGVWWPCVWLNPCYAKITDPICLATKALKKVVSSVVRFVKKVIVEIELLVNSAFTGLSKIAKDVLESAKLLVDDAVNDLKWIRKQVGYLETQALEAIKTFFESFVLEKLILGAELTADYSACVSYDLDATFNKVPYQSNGKVCLDIKGLILEFRNLVLDNLFYGKSSPVNHPNIRQQVNTLDEAEKKNEVNELKEQSYNDEEEAAKKEINEAEAKNFEEEYKSIQNDGKRSDIPHHAHIAHYEKFKPWLKNLAKKSNRPRTEEEEEMQQFVDEPSDPYEPRFDYELRSFINRGPWYFKSKKDDKKRGFIPFPRNDSAETWKRSLHFDDQLTPCNRMKRALNGFSDLTTGLMDYTNSLHESKTQNEKYIAERRSKIEQLRHDIMAKVQKHNVSEEDAEKMNYIYEKTLDGHEDFVKRANMELRQSNVRTMPMIREQLNGMLKRDYKKSFMEMTESMHVNAMKGYKRSNIPHPSDVKGEAMLENIKEDLQDIVTNDYEDAPVVPLATRLNTVKKNIVVMQRYANQCKA